MKVKITAVAEVEIDEDDFEAYSEDEPLQLEELIQKVESGAEGASIKAEQAD